MTGRYNGVPGTKIHGAIRMLMIIDATGTDATSPWLGANTYLYWNFTGI